ncbi:MAG: ATP-dependent helicase UvrD/PcrA [Chloroflexota bacterium]|jgi:hypothetical protein|nr:ATP-dependent helicase UvrD/PcrA [Chloroflexota bacterium]
MTGQTELLADRERYMAQMVSSTSPKKLVIAGPGTGKTSSFGRVLGGDPDRNLVLSFINNLVRDLDRDLGERATVRTLHRYAVGVLHSLAVPGIDTAFEMYPPLIRLLPAEVGLIQNAAQISHGQLERSFHRLDDAQGLISAYLTAANYYNAVSHVDSVYRLVHFWQTHPDRIRRYNQIVVDEIQDFSQLELQLIDLLGQKSPVLAAGDDDQSLYRFKHASPNLIRDLAARGDFQRFELPYCSRCPEVMVLAFHDVVRAALAAGNLKGRLDKQFICFLPDKVNDSQRFTKIASVWCSVEKHGLRYAGRYIASEIEKIDAADVEESYGRKYPTALVIGPKQFTAGVREVLEARGHQLISPPPGESEEPLLVHGYKLLFANGRSRLGWRIVLAAERNPATINFVKRVISEGAELRDLLDADYVSRHLRFAQLVGRLLAGEELGADAVTALSDQTGQTIEEIRRALRLVAEPVPALDQTRPSVQMTSLVGAKGLSGGHVFVVGFNAGHFPRRPQSPTDDEVSQFLVALTRTRKRSHLISYGRLGAEGLKASPFLTMIEPGRYEWIRVDKKYISKLPS